MLINSEDIKIAKKHLEVIQAFINGKEIEFKQICNNDHYRKVSTPTWDFVNYAYRIKPSEPEYVNTIELFEVMIYWDTAEDFKINGTLYSNEELKQLQHYQKTGRSFIIDEDTRQIIKVNYN